jgi:hypothetical protein
MRQLQLLLIILFLAWFGTGLSKSGAQVAIPAVGNDAYGVGGTVNYSVGQVFYKTINGPDISTVQGVQHPYEIYEVTAIENKTDLNTSILVYPNPGMDYIKLKVKNTEISDLRYQLFDMQGKLVQNEKITGTGTANINMSQCVPATYFIKVIQEGEEVKTFKIVKK